MKVKSSIFLTTVVCIILFNLPAFYAAGQTKDSTRILLAQPEVLTKLAPVQLIPVTENTLPNNKTSFLPNSNQQNRFSTNDWLLSRPKTNSPKIEFELNTTQNIFPNLGQSNQFSGKLNYQLFDKIRINMGMGLYQQNTVFSPWNINYQLGVTSSVEYSFNSWLSTYIYGQYISPSLSQKDFTDALQFMDPMFNQKEFGGGLQAKYRSIKARVGMKNISDRDLEENKFSTNYFQSKVSFGF